jgi:hypothetical protein
VKFCSAVLSQNSIKAFDLRLLKALLESSLGRQQVPVCPRRRTVPLGTPSGACGSGLHVETGPSI